MSTIATMMRAARERAEGLDFSRHAPAGLDRSSPYARVRRRRGLGPFRQAWWIHSRHERYTTLRRYAMLLDWAMGEPATRTNPAVLPPNARLVAFRLGHLGDVLHLLPTLAEIRRQRPDVRIELVTGPWNRDLLARYPWLDAVHSYTPDVYQFNRGNRAGSRTPEGERAFIREVRGRGVDAVFCPTPPHFAELPFIVGLRPAHYVGGEWPLDVAPEGLARHTRAFDSRHYELDAVADFLPLFGLERRPVRLAYAVSEDSTEKVDAYLRERGWSDDTVVTVFPGSGWPGKCWPPAAFAALADALVDAGGARIVLAGSPAEKTLCEQVRAAMRHPADVVAGAFSIDASAALIARAALVVGNDSAPIHFAAALSIPTASVWGPTFPEKWAPRGARHSSVARSGSCRGCTYWHPAAACTGHPPCIETVAVSTVLDAILRAGVLPRPAAHKSPTCCSTHSIS